MGSDPQAGVSIAEDQRIITRDAWVAHELELVGLPTDDAGTIAQACEDLTLAGVGGWFANVRAVIDAWLQRGSWGPIE